MFFLCFASCFYQQKPVLVQITRYGGGWPVIYSINLIVVVIRLDKNRGAMYNKLNYLIIFVLIVISIAQN
ncbi:hypothetical protein SD53_11785 [Rheinheimera mesophila]|nr:hypothetical protein SD53_11785 [Rheinheimera mesophila]